jgi:spoIIIJ-associated protein
VGDAVRAREVLGEILKRMGIEATIELREEPERSVLDIKGPEAGLVIGKKGMTLDSLQYLIGKIIHRGEPLPEGEAAAAGRRTIIVDAEGYRTRREASLVELAHRLSEKAIRTNKTITVNPMSPHDRRIIHITLDKVPGVTTRSEGEGVFRRLLIVPQPDKV